MTEPNEPNEPNEPAPPFTTPDWAKHAIFYQIFPERFCNGDPSRSPENVQPWGTTPTPKNFMGGDLAGIINRLDYLADLGVTALYLNPIFHASSNHKYNTYNYEQIDPHFGDLDTFHTLIARAHERGIRVVLDAVFNHCGRGFFAFHDLLENHADSPYRNWFTVHGFPLYAYDTSHDPNYACWWNIHSLPKFNTNHEPVRRYLLGVARYWIEQGADGWRLDVPEEIDDHEFWREFRRVVKAANPDAYIVGEIWKDASPWLDGTQFDAVMNYLLRDLCRDFFARAKIGARAFADGVQELLTRYPREATLVQLNLLGSHDTTRFRTLAGGDVTLLYPAVLFQMTFPGAPCIYYGDEIGMEGGKEPLSRGCFPWDEAQWNHELRAWVQQCARLRHAHTALRTGDVRVLLANDEIRTCVLARWDEHACFVVAFSTDYRTHTIDIPLADVPAPTSGTASDVLNGAGEPARYPIRDGQIVQVAVPGRGGVVLQLQP